MNETPAVSQVAGAPAVATPAASTTAGVQHPATMKRPFKYHFKKDKLGVKRATIELAIPVPTVEGVIQMLNDPKQTEYLLEVLAEQAYKAARDQVGDDAKPVNKQEELDESKLTMEALANMPKAERTGGGIGKEVWEAFSEDYIAVMPAITSKSAEQVGNACKLLIAKFQPVKTNKKVIEFLKGQLALWFSSSTNAEEFQECYEFLDAKADTLLKADEAALLANL